MTSQHEARELLAKVRANRLRLEACTLHRFEVTPESSGMVMGKRYVCLHCHGEVDGHAHYWYAMGLAHGGVGS
jgi:hypothetical protein